MYNVRIGKKCPTVYVRTPKGAVLRYTTTLPSRGSAKKLAGQVRSRLKRGGKLNPKHWTIVRKPLVLVDGPQAI